ncbi:MAG: glycosyltransferase family 2 protein [Psychroflexus sp.]|nr:glycosyltransferase family 2 protein [Psychroflexus sp.]
MKIAIVILNWNGVALLKKYLPAVIKNSSKAKIYVVDNASTDDSIDYIKRNFPDIYLIRLKDNYGYAEGYNKAVAQIDEPIQILMNNDVAPADNWLTPIQDSFKNNISLAALQPKILADKDKTKFEYAGACGGYIDQLGYPFCRGRLFDHLENDQQQYDNVVDIFWASGACLAVRKKVFQEVGGFDELYFAHQEEIDLCWRIKNAGYNIIVNPQSVVYHLGGGTLNTLDPKKTFYNFRNSLFNLFKNAPDNKYKKLIFIRMILDGVAFFFFISQFKLKHAVMILKAHKDFYKLKSKIKRDSSFKITQYYYKKNILVDFFIMGKKRFIDLKKLT